MSGLTASARRALLVVVIALASVLFSTVAFAQTLTVALYPYVPRIDQFETAIRQAWQQVQPGVPLNFIDDLNVWDGGYDKDPPAQADVYVFDAMYFEQFRANNFLVAMAPNEIQNAADFLSYARDAVIVSGNYYAIPQLGCANILFYNVNDAPVANAGTLSQLKGALNQCTYTSEIPPDRRGLMLDMDGRTTNATLYLDIAHSVNGSYPLPQPAQPNASYIADQKTMLNTSSFWDITSQNPNAYIRGVWYSQGYGRALMGFHRNYVEHYADRAFQHRLQGDAALGHDHQPSAVLCRRRGRQYHDCPARHAQSCSATRQPHRIDRRAGGKLPGPVEHNSAIPDVGSQQRVPATRSALPHLSTDVSTRADEQSDCIQARPERAQLGGGDGRHHPQPGAGKLHLRL